MFTNLLCASVPYLAVGIGLLVFHNAWIAVLAYHAGMAAVIFFSKPTVPVRYSVRSGTWSYLVFSAVVGASGGILLYLLWPLLSIPLDISHYLQSIGLTALTWPYFLAYCILVNPVLEEYYWRGCLGSSAKRPVLTDFLFAGYHLLVIAGNVGGFWLIAVFAGLCFAAWYWRQLNRFTGGLLAATASHMAADATVFLAIYFLTAGA